MYCYLSISNVWLVVFTTDNFQHKGFKPLKRGLSKRPNPYLLKIIKISKNFTKNSKWLGRRGLDSNAELVVYQFRKHTFEATRGLYISSDFRTWVLLLINNIIAVLVHCIGHFIQWVISVVSVTIFVISKLFDF